ncbi:TPA: CDP-alcohol phosphatidyltransferase family protein [Clostridioides difficile]
MLSSTFSSLPFWICYFWCGISDILDGLIARKLRQQSGIGAKLDSIADFILRLQFWLLSEKILLFPCIYGGVLLQ